MSGEDIMYGRTISADVDLKIARLHYIL